MSTFRTVVKEAKTEKGLGSTFYVQRTAQENVATMPVADLIRAIVRRFNYSDGYDLWRVLTALRGPDSDEDALKYQTTSTLRALIGMKDNEGSTGAIVKNYKPLGYNELDYIETTRVVRLAFPDSQHHFCNHYALALETLKKLGFTFES